MTLWTLIARSLRFRARSHLGVALGATVGSAALIGALVVGDSVRESLREMALRRLGWVDTALAPIDSFFGQRAIPLADGDPKQGLTAALRLPAVGARQDGTARAAHVQAIGVSAAFWLAVENAAFTNFPAGTVLLNDALAAQLHARAGDDVVLRVHKPSALSRDAPITPRSDSSVALRLKVHGVVPASAMGNFDLHARQLPPQNAFLHLNELARAAGLEGKANLLLAGRWQGYVRYSGPKWLQRLQIYLRGSNRRANLSPEEGTNLWNELFHKFATLADYELELRRLPDSRVVELRTSRIFLPPPVERTALALRGDSTPQPVLTYLVNLFRAGDRTVPYSMVAAAGPPYAPADLGEDEIVINQWLADDLKAGPGDTVALTYFLPDVSARLVERTNQFRVRSVVPLEGLYADRTLMPEFPGLAKAESTHDWDAGFPLVHKIRDEDEQYWKQYRGTPKAFVSLAAGQKLWGNRFGNVTAIRFSTPANVDADAFNQRLVSQLRSALVPAELGLRFEPVRAQALAAANQAQDFGGLFLGFSFFLILAALILMALLFQFGLEQRTTEVGTLLALGFTPKQVRRLLLWEGAALALLGGIAGAFAGSAYARAMLGGLTTVWRDAVASASLSYHATTSTVLLGVVASVMVGTLTIGLVLRQQAKRPARELLAEGSAVEFQISNLKSQKGRLARWIAVGSLLVALALVGWVVSQKDASNAEAFFGAGSLLLIAGLAGVAVLLTGLARAEARRRLTLMALGLRGCVRRRKRSLATVALLACGTFLIAAIGAFRLDENQKAASRSSGTGGFAFLGESALPVVQDLNTKDGRDFFNLDEQALSGVEVVPLRVREGDEASCLNLNRAQTPRLLGVKPEQLDGRHAFTFAKIATGLPADAPWLLLKGTAGTVPAIGDQASILWALGKKVGDTLDYTDERGRAFKVRLVGAVANSILQGNLLIDEAEFVRRFPGESGYRMFLIDAPSNSLMQVSATLSRALQDVGLELTPTRQRLAAFNAVQNTYLTTFQVLGGLGLLLGSAGLGVVVLRNVLERRGELGLLQAVGFRRRALQWLVLSEHGALLGLGLIVGVIAAVLAILPALLSPGAELPYRSLTFTLGAVLASGLGWTWVATWLALRGRLVEALRNE